ncbi:hypothetical protein EV188_10355 [Actinomycetospora succinea]|uniref:Polyketide cyclase/dehydrase/lipid transport protein n=1 Tax=Actinomycetospora succinea TaxID=663603 RepID=A0A4R6VDY3_9PSEU|nr:hypothetical protein [Actinomycetospora succinea]TDQ60561.1 hypothetical protein EV188_10355 [Actinomycetospora succinea]
MGLVDAVAATDAEVREPRRGDGLVVPADIVMDRAFTLAHEPDVVWPWIVQLGKRRAGWYLPARAERLVPRRRHAAVRIVERWQHLAPGDVIPDYGGRDEVFVVDEIDPPHVLVYRSRRGRTDVSWSITLRPVSGGTRVLLRLRLGPVRHVRLAETVGGAFDALTIAGLAAGLRERLSRPAAP